jgi:hypothetical protein
VTPVLLTAWAAVLAAVTAAAAMLPRRDAGWFHPLALPFAALAIMSFAAPLWVYLTRMPAGGLYDPGHPPAVPSPLAVPMTLAACEALLLVLVGYLTGVVAALARTPRPSARKPSLPVFRQGMRGAGLALMTAGAGAGLAVAWLNRGTVYGAGQFEYGPAAVLQPIAATALLAGLITVTLVGEEPGRLRDLLRGREWLILTAYLLAVALTGARGGLLPPLVYLAWAYGTRVRQVSLRQVTAALVVTVVAGAMIASYRSGDGLSPGSPDAVTTRAVSAVSSPAWLTQETVAAVPSIFPYTHGSTYLAAAEGQLPGPLARSLGATRRTASAVFRDIIGFTNPGQGFAESLPSEAYLNFGLMGCLSAGVFLGLLMGWAWRKAGAYGVRPRDLLYPVLLAGLIAGFRSDALAQVKEVLYPLLVTGVLMAGFRLQANAPRRAARRRSRSGRVPADLCLGGEVAAWTQGGEPNTSLIKVPEAGLSSWNGH